MANEHFNVSNFVVSIEGMQADQFTEVSPVEIQTEVLPYQEGSMKVQQSRKGRTRYAPITFTRRFNGDKELSDWKNLCATGEVEKRSGSIIFNDDNGNEVRRINWTNGWPCGYRVQSLSTTSENQVCCEEVTLDVETIEFA